MSGGADQAKATIAAQAMLNVVISICGDEPQNYATVVSAIVGTLTTAIASSEEPDEVVSVVIRMLDEARPVIAKTHAKIYAEVARREAIALGATPSSGGGQPS